MREIDLKASETSDLPFNTFLVYGNTRVGKSTWAGTFPRPLFLSDVSEKGYESLREENWDDETTPRFESDVQPIVWGIEQQTDMAEAVLKIEPLVKAGRIKTVVIDSLSFYSDLIFNFILMKQTKSDTRGAYGDLGTHLRNVRIKLHSLGCNVVWLCLAKDPDADNPTGGPMIPGQQADKFAAGVDFIFHFRLEQPVPTKPPMFQIRTKRYAGYIAGNRLGGRANLLPDPMIGNYASMMTHLGYDVDAIRSALPSISLIKIPVAAAPVKVQAPPIAKTTVVVSKPGQPAKSAV